MTAEKALPSLPLMEPTISLLPSTSKWNMLFPLLPTPHQFHLPHPIRSQPQHIPFGLTVSKLVVHKTQTHMLYTETACERFVSANVYKPEPTEDYFFIRKFSRQTSILQKIPLAANTWTFHEGT